MKETTIKKLLGNNDKVYVYLANETIGKTFLLKAENEGFKFSDGEKPTNKHYSDLIAVNRNNTLSYVGSIGRIAVASNKVEKVDFEKYLSE